MSPSRGRVALTTDHPEPLCAFVAAVCVFCLVWTNGHPLCFNWTRTSQRENMQRKEQPLKHVLATCMTMNVNCAQTVASVRMDLLLVEKSHSVHNAYKNSLCWFGNMTAGLLLSYCHDRPNNTIPEMSQRRLIKTELRVIEECVRVQNNKTQCNTAAWVCIHPNETKPSIRKQHKTKAKQLFGLIQYYNSSKQNTALFFDFIKMQIKMQKEIETAVWTYLKYLNKTKSTAKQQKTTGFVLHIQSQNKTAWVFDLVLHKCKIKQSKTRKEKSKQQKINRLGSYYK